MDYDNSKQVILRQVTSDKPNAPVMSVQFEVAGVKMEAPLWLWTKKDGTEVLDSHGKKMYQGNYKEDTYTQEVNAKGMADAKAAADPADPFDPEVLPF